MSNDNRINRSRTNRRVIIKDECRDTTVPEDLIKREYSHFPHLIGDIATDVIHLKSKIEALRKEYQRLGMLPLYSGNSEHENLTRLIEYLEAEVLKFYIHGTKDNKIHSLIKSYSSWIKT